MPKYRAVVTKGDEYEVEVYADNPDAAWVYIEQNDGSWQLIDENVISILHIAEVE